MSTAYLQKFLTWPKRLNGESMGIALFSSVLWASVGVLHVTKRIGDVGTLAVSLCANCLYIFLFAFVTEPWQVFVPNAALVGPGVMAFPATSAIKSRLVAKEEQGHLQGALNTGKSMAEALGPVLFGGLFTLVTSGPSETQTMLSRVPMFVGCAMLLPLLAVLRSLPDLS